MIGHAAMTENPEHTLTVIRDGQIVHDIAPADRLPNDILVGRTYVPASPWARTISDDLAKEQTMARYLGGERYVTAKPNLYEVHYDGPVRLALPGNSGVPGYPAVPVPCYWCAMAGVVGGVQYVWWPRSSCGLARALPHAVYGQVPCDRCDGTGLQWKGAR